MKGNIASVSLGRWRSQYGSATANTLTRPFEEVDMRCLSVRIKVDRTIRLTSHYQVDYVREQPSEWDALAELHNSPTMKIIKCDFKCVEELLTHPNEEIRKIGKGVVEGRVTYDKRKIFKTKT